MKFVRNFNVGLRDIGAKSTLTNYGILSFLEDIGSIHSNSVGYGLNDLSKIHKAWMIIDWKLNVFKRLNFGDNVIVRTWVTQYKRDKFYIYRNFEVVDKNGDLVATAISKWIIYDTENKKIVRIDEEEYKVFEAERTEEEVELQIPKLKEPTSYESFTSYEAKRGDIDINKHIHNTNYIKLAFEAIPEKFFWGEEPNNVHIFYKKQILLGEKVKCFYSYEDKKHFVTIKSEDEKVLHAIIELY